MYEIIETDNCGRTCRTVIFKLQGATPNLFLKVVALMLNSLIQITPFKYFFFVT